MTLHNLESDREGNCFQTGERAFQCDHNTGGMHKDLYRKLPVKENPVCCNSENPWSSGKTEST